MLATIPFSAYASSEHAVPTDGTDYTRISKEVTKGNTGFSGAKEAREEDGLTRAGYVSSGSSYKWYDKSTDDVYTAYNAVGVGYMY